MKYIEELKRTLADLKAGKQIGEANE